MARVTFVKKARQRYAMVPVLDEDGTPKRTPVMRRVKDHASGEWTEVPRKTKTGKEVTMAVTVADKSRPLPNLRCDFPGCGGEILPGTPYKHITPRSGPYGGTQRNRHAAHPSWQVWEYSYSTSARVAQVSSEIEDMLQSFEFSDFSDFEDARQQAADMAAELRDEKEETLNNMPEQLQDGSQTQEQFEALESWVEAIEGADAPDEASAECDECEGTGKVENPDYDPDVEEPLDGEDEEEVDCEVCGGTGGVDGPDEDWAEAAREAIMDAVNECDL